MMEPLEGRELLAVVTTVADSGPGSLRDAIVTVNADPSDNAITFNIPGSGVQSIALLSELPALTEPVTIDGFTQPGAGGLPLIELDGNSAGAASRGLILQGGNSTVRGLAINRFGSHAIVLQNSSGNRVEGNVLGLDPGATLLRPNGGAGVYIDQASSNVVGGTSAGQRNTIGGNGGGGVLIVGINSDTNVVQGNAIGTDATGSLDLGNSGDGVQINAGSNNTVGGNVAAAGNTIAFNTGNGVHVLAGSGNLIVRNSTFLNDGLGILIDSGANNDIASPALTMANTSGGVTTISGSVTGPAGTYTVDFYSNTSQEGTSPVEGRTYVGSTTVTITPPSGATTGTGSFSASVSAVALNNLVVATATDGGNNTSGFSAFVTNTTPTADLSLTGSRDPEPVAQNGYLVYTYTISNPGPSAATVTFSDVLPSTLSFVQATSSIGSINHTGNTVTGSLGSMPAGASATVTIQVVPTTTGTIVNTATITAPEDPNAANNTVTLSSTVVPGVDVGVTAVAEPVPAVVGENWQVSFVVTNGGPATATNVTFEGNIPANLPLGSVTSSQGTVTIRADRLFYSVAVGSLAPGASARVTVIMKPNAVGTAELSGVAKSSEPDRNISNNTKSATAPIVESTVPPESLPPFVDRLSRFGVHTQATSILVGFTQPLLESSAKSLTNYQLVAPGADGRFGTRDDHRIAIDTATYDNVNRTVTLNLKHRLPLSTRVQLTVVGVRPDGVRNLDGTFLAGQNGIPGTNFVRVFSGRGPGSLTGAVGRALRIQGTAR